MTDDDTAIRIDSHAHVFHRDLPLVAGHRHAPQHDAPLPELLKLFDHRGIAHHSAGLTCGVTFDWLTEWVPGQAARACILGKTPWDLFGFDGSPTSRD